MATFRLPRLPVNWKEQPQLFERYWDEVSNQIEKTLNAILTLPALQQSIEDAQSTADDAADIAAGLAGPQYIVAALNAVLNNERVLSGTGGLSVSYATPSAAIISFTNGTSGSGSVALTTGPTLTLPKIVGYTVAGLPAGSLGARAHVTDATAPVFLAPLTGGGTVVTPVFHNGTTWVAG